MLEANFCRHNVEIPFPQRDLNIRSPQWDAADWTQQFSKQASPVLEITEQQTPGLTSHDLLADTRDYSSLLQNHQHLQDALLERLVKQMRSEEGLETQNRRFQLLM